MIPEDWFQELVKIGSIGGSMYIFFRGIQEYRINNQVKRAEFLNQLIAEFNQPKNRIALRLLDDFVYVADSNIEQSFSRQEERDIDLKRFLRDHRESPIQNEDEIKVRDSFDNLLDFFTKLSYYLQNKLITKNELIYFKYYLKKTEGKQPVRHYIETYFYAKDFQYLFNAIR